MRTIVLIVLGCLSLAPFAMAQDRDTVFLHGLDSDPSQWNAEVGRLVPKLAIRPHQPPLDWTASYEAQATSVERALGAALTGEIVAVGHSNGGIVARQWAKSREVRSLITIGAPNQGAPIVDHLFEWFQFLDDILARMSNVSAVYAQAVDHDVWWWLPAQWLPRFSAAVDLWDTANNGLLSLGLDARLPVMPEMRVASAYMTSLNSASTLNQEAMDIRDRAAIISVPKDFNFGGPFRLLDPDHYETWHDGIWATGIALDGLAGIVQVTADVSDLDAFDLADRISSVAEWFLQFEEVWCRSVSDPSPYAVGHCYEHDGIVPAWSQAYDSPRVQFIVASNGPIHTREMSETDDQLFQALTSIAHVPAREESAPGAGALPQDPSSPPSSTPVVPGRYKLESGKCVWRANDSGPDQCTPPPGRYKLSGGKCTWAPNDAGPNQCTPAAAPPSGRYKLSGGKCTWAPNDSGPNQCTPAAAPPLGRYKLSGGKCTWAPNDSGPNQCTP
jgi:pimeloyl-ACP methyl ester carboxylesterase